MDTKVEKAINSFRSGCNCAQSVLSAFSDELNLDSNTAQSISSGFGGGMGKLQETCGAVTGSFMVFGLYSGQRYADNQERKEKTNALIRNFSKQFTFIHGTTNCKSLIKADLNTVEGQQYIKDQQVMEHVCEHCISDSIKIAEKLLL